MKVVVARAIVCACIWGRILPVFGQDAAADATPGPSRAEVEQSVQSAFDGLMLTRVDSLEAVADQYRERVEMLLPILVPSPAFIHVEEGGFLVLPRRALTSRIMKRLIPEEHPSGVAVYRATFERRPKTWQVVVRNARDQIARVMPCERAFDPASHARVAFGALPPNQRTRRKLLELLRLYDPSRVAVSYRLLVGRQDAARLAVYQGAMAAMAVDEGGGRARMMGGGESVTGLTFHAIQAVGPYGASNQSLHVTLAWPPGFTNRFTLIEGSSLVEADWDWSIVFTTNPPPATNMLTHVKTDWLNYETRYFLAYDDTVEHDEDGMSTGWERYIGGTNPEDSDDPPNVKGTTVYDGRQGGTMNVIAATSAGSWVSPHAIQTTDPGNWHLVNLPPGDYWIKSWRDSIANGTVDITSEAWVEYAGNPLTVDGMETNIVLTLEDADTDSDGLPDWWEGFYLFGLGESGDDDHDLDGLNNLLEYTLNADPTVSDTDGDGMGDGAEYAHGNDPVSSNAYATLPFEEDFELYDVLRGDEGAQNFGGAIDFDGERAIVGAQDASGGTNGVAYVFRWDGTNWLREDVLRAWSGSAGDRFGSKVAIRDDTAVVGAFFDDDAGTDAGAAYIFERTGTNWGPRSKVTAFDADPGDRFGEGVAMGPGLLAVGAPWDRAPYNKDGSVYIYRWDGAAWTNDVIKQEYTGPGYCQHMGTCMDFTEDGNTLVVGQYDSFTGAGRVGVCDWNGSSWSAVRQLGAAGLTRFDYFGSCVAIRGNNLLAVGARNEERYADDNHPPGAAYVFERNASNDWVEVARLQPPGLGDDASFGCAVAFAGDRLAVGSYANPRRIFDYTLEIGDMPNAGAVYFYEENGGSWELESVAEGELSVTNARFGIALAGCNDLLLVGANGSVTTSVDAVYTCRADALGRFPLETPYAALWGRSGWDVEPTNGSVYVTDTFDGDTAVAAGTSPTELRYVLSAAGASTVWVDFRARYQPPRFGMPGGHPSTNAIAPWQPSFFAVNSEGQVVAYDGDGNGGGAWVVAPDVTIAGMNGYDRFTIKQDYSQREWDLYVNEVKVLDDLGFSRPGIAEFSCFSFHSGWGGMSYLDTVRVSVDAPEFE